MFDFSVSFCDLFKVDVSTRFHFLMRNFHHHLIYLGCLRRGPSEENEIAHKDFNFIYNGTKNTLTKFRYSCCLPESDIRTANILSLPIVLRLQHNHPHLFPNISFSFFCAYNTSSWHIGSCHTAKLHIRYCDCSEMKYGLVDVSRH